MKGTGKILSTAGTEWASRRPRLPARLGTARHPLSREPPRAGSFTGPALGEDAARPADCLLDGSKVSQERKPRPCSWLSEISG